MFFAGSAGHHDIPAVDPDPHILPRHEIDITMMAEPAPEFTIDPYPLAHRDLPCQIHITVAPFGMVSISQSRLLEEYANTFPGDHPRCRVAGLLSHGLLLTASRLCYTISVAGKKGSAVASLLTVTYSGSEIRR